MIQQQTAFLTGCEPWACLISSTKAPNNKKNGIANLYFYVLVENVRRKLLSIKSNTVNQILQKPKGEQLVCLQCSKND